jgi:hypothetical protein
MIDLREISTNLFKNQPSIRLSRLAATAFFVLSVKGGGRLLKGRGGGEIGFEVYKTGSSAKEN